MATYSITTPGGQQYQIEGPDNADPSAIIAQLQGVHRPHSLDLLLGGKTAPTGSSEAVAARSPVSQSDTQNFLAGAGKGMTDLARGAGQWLGLESRDDVAESRKLDAPLMETKAGKAGDVVGVAAPLAAATRFIPGANTLAGSAAIGAGSGLLMPSTSTGETALNAGVGAASGPLGLLLGRGLGALYQGGKAALRPFFSGGGEDIASNTLRSFAGGDAAAQAAAQELQNAAPGLPGVRPNMGELTTNPGLANLQRTLANNPEVSTLISGQDQANRGVIQQALDAMRGTAAQRAAAVTARGDLARPLYEQATSAVVPADAELGRILARPSMRSAWQRAAQLAEEQGESLATGQAANDITGRTLQYLRMGLSDLADSGPTTGMGTHEQNAVRGTLRALNSWITDNVPTLRAADSAYAQASRPINQMDVANQLRDRLVPALGDFGNVPRMNANAFANALRNGDDIAADVVGRQNARLEDVMSPEQQTTLRQIGEHLARRANAADLGRAAGSNTAQNLAGQNVLRQFMGPLGLPESTLGRAAQSTLGRTIARPYGWAAQAAEPDVLRALARASINPQEAARLLMRNPSSAVAQRLWANQGLLGPLATTGTLGLLRSGYAAQ